MKDENNQAATTPAFFFLIIVFLFFFTFFVKYSSTLDMLTCVYSCPLFLCLLLSFVLVSTDSMHCPVRRVLRNVRLLVLDFRSAELRLLDLGLHPGADRQWELPALSPGRGAQFWIKALPLQHRCGLHCCGVFTLFVIPVVMTVWKHAQSHPCSETNICSSFYCLFIHLCLFLSRLFIKKFFLFFLTFTHLPLLADDGWDFSSILNQLADGHEPRLVHAFHGHGCCQLCWSEYKSNTPPSVWAIFLTYMITLLLYTYEI